MTKISDFLGSLECIRGRDLALSTVEGGIAVVRALQSETPPSLEAEEARLSDCKGDLVAVDGDFNLVLADLKSACLLPTCLEDPEGKDPVVGENGGDAAPSLDEVMDEEGHTFQMIVVVMISCEIFFLCLCFGRIWPYFVFRDWPFVALNPCRFAIFFL